jgi:hypothetical protein
MEMKFPETIGDKELSHRATAETPRSVHGMRVDELGCVTSNCMYFPCHPFSVGGELGAKLHVF